LNSHLKIFAVVAAMALLVPAGATAKRPEGKPEKGSKHGKLGGQKQAKEPKLKLASTNVKGVVTANDGATMTVTVEKASGHAKACKGSDLTFDVSGARFHSADNEPDGDVDAADFLVGHVVKVRTKLALLKGKKTTCLSAEAEALALPAAKAVQNKSTPQVEEDETEVEVEAPEVDETEEV